jgi:dTMP kinase
LIEVGKTVISLREPGGTIISEQIRPILLSPNSTQIAPRTEVLLFQAARAQIYHEVVIPALNQGKSIIMDRTRDSSVAYQGIVEGFGEQLIDQLNEFSTQQIVPTITFLLDVDIDTALKRRANTGNMNRIDMLNHGFHQKVRQAYLDLVHRDATGRWVVIDASQDINQVATVIWQHMVDRKLC